MAGSFFSFPMQHVSQIGGFVTEKKVENLHFLIKYCVCRGKCVPLCPFLSGLVKQNEHSNRKI